MSRNYLITAAYSFVVFFGAVFFASAETSVILTATSTNKSASFTAELSGKNVVVPVNTNVTGIGKLVFNSSLTQAITAVNLENAKGVTQADIYCGSPVRDNESVAQIFSSKGKDINGVLAIMTLNDEDISETACSPQGTVAGLLDAAKNGQLYVNVRSASYPAGVVRGQFVSSSPADMTQNNPKNLLDLGGYFSNNSFSNSGQQATTSPAGLNLSLENISKILQGMSNVLSKLKEIVNQMVIAKAV